MTINQLLALKPGVKVSIIKPGYNCGRVMTFIGWVNTKPVMARLTDHGIPEIWFDACDIEYYTQGE